MQFDVASAMRMAGEPGGVTPVRSSGPDRPDRRMPGRRTDVRVSLR
ncbi:hypothetical protein HNP84_008175 [Thermocatellispora tengchongensis]|uniref:Uncharacterized protein n=1 Tax=Thermocatellispora tengchongensis TaxID=1073253 RepID=A0A840PKV1_9ACTN|nr:hypothetical protein [Thermocatellispora tengchongensis]